MMYSTGSDGLIYSIYQCTECSVAGSEVKMSSSPGVDGAVSDEDFSWGSEECPELQSATFITKEMWVSLMMFIAFCLFYSRRGYLKPKRA